MNTAVAPILDHMAALADPIRCRMLLPLERHELTVGEICSVLQLPQSTVSRHLKTLADDGWVVSRRDGTSRFYGMVTEDLDGGAQRLWSVIREQVSGTNGAEQDDRRLKTVLARRRSKSEEFFASASGQWEVVRANLFGERFDLHALLALLDADLVVGDLGCGTGHVSALIAPHVGPSHRGRRLDRHGARRAAAAQRRDQRRPSARRARSAADRRRSARCRDRRPGAAPRARIPSRTLAEVRRVLKPGGRVLVVDMLPHDRSEYQQQMGHVWLGFSEKTIKKHLEGAGFERATVRPLPEETDAKGPGLFAATAVKVES